MRFVHFNTEGRVEQAVNDETLEALPENVFAVTDEQWVNRFDLKLVDGEILNDPAGLETPEPVIKTKFLSLEFLERFTEAEQIAVVQATMVIAPVKLWYDKLLAASYVDLNDPRVEAGIDALIAAELIAADRKASLLAAQEV